MFKSFLILDMFDFYKELNTSQKLSFIGGVYCIVKALQNLDNGGFIWITVSLVFFLQSIYLKIKNEVFNNNTNTCCIMDFICFDFWYCSCKRSN